MIFDMKIPTPSVQWGYIRNQTGQVTDIRFDDHTRNVTAFGILQKMVQKTTVQSNYPVKVRSKKVKNCTIIGDGTVQHFGVNFEDHPPATVKVICQSMDQNEVNLKV